MAVNVTANWHLIRAMDPLLKRSDAGRAVFVTSGVATLARAYWAPYSVSKAALDVLARTYAAETSFDAGAGQSVRSRPDPHPHARQVMPGEDPMTLPTPEEVAAKIVDCACRNLRRPEKSMISRGKLLKFMRPA